MKALLYALQLLLALFFCLCSTKERVQQVKTFSRIFSDCSLNCLC